MAKKSSIKTEKASAVFTRLYGRAAYEAWKAREAEIDELVRQHVYSRSEIIELRESNFRRMKLGKPDSMPSMSAASFKAVISPIIAAA